MTPHIEQMLNDLKLIPTGPPFWDEQAMAWKIPCAPRCPVYSLLLKLPDTINDDRNDHRRSDPE